MIFPYTSQCEENCKLVLEPVPGAKHYPLRLVCTEHGYPQEKRTNTIAARPDVDPPNVYASEVASPADIIQIGGNEISTY
jgi:hypothetical protein